MAHAFKWLRCSCVLLLALTQTWKSWYMVVSASISSGISILLSLLAARIYNPTNNVWGLSFFYTPVTTLFLVFLIIAILMIVRWYLIMVWICIFLTISRVEPATPCTSMFTAVFKITKTRKELKCPSIDNALKRC